MIKHLFVAEWPTLEFLSLCQHVININFLCNASIIQPSKWQSQCRYPRSPVAQILWPRWPQRKSIVISSMVHSSFRKTLSVTCGAKQDSKRPHQKVHDPLNMVKMEWSIWKWLNTWAWVLAGIDSMPTRIWVNGGHFILHSIFPSLALLPLFQSMILMLKQKRSKRRNKPTQHNTAQHNKEKKKQNTKKSGKFTTTTNKNNLQKSPSFP